MWHLFVRNGISWEMASHEKLFSQVSQSSGVHHILNRGSIIKIKVASLITQILLESSDSTLESPATVLLVADFISAPASWPLKDMITLHKYLLHREPSSPSDWLLVICLVGWGAFQLPLTFSIWRCSRVNESLFTLLSSSSLDSRLCRTAQLGVLLGIKFIAPICL